MICKKLTILVEDQKKLNKISDSLILIENSIYYKFIECDNEIKKMFRNHPLYHQMYAAF